MHDNSARRLDLARLRMRAGAFAASWMDKVATRAETKEIRRILTADDVQQVSDFVVNVAPITDGLGHFLPHDLPIPAA
jgi:hypothetical protein